MDKSSVEETVTLFTEDDELDTGVKVTRLKLINTSAYYRALLSSGMQDAGMLKLTVPDVSKTVLQTVVDFIEADDKHIVVPTSLGKLEEVNRKYFTIILCPLRQSDCIHLCAIINFNIIKYS